MSRCTNMSVKSRFFSSTWAASQLNKDKVLFITDTVDKNIVNGCIGNIFTKISSRNHISHVVNGRHSVWYSHTIAVAADSHAPPAFLDGIVSTTTIFDLFHITILGNASRRSPYGEIWNCSAMYVLRISSKRPLLRWIDYVRGRIMSRIMRSIVAKPRLQY